MPNARRLVVSLALCALLAPAGSLLAISVGEAEAAYQAAIAAEKAHPTKANAQAADAALTALLALQGGPTGAVERPDTAPTPVAETEPNGTSATANAISLAAGYAIVNASINPAADLDFFTITGVPAGARIWVEADTGGTQIAGATSRDTVMDVLAADGTTVIENDDDDGTGNGADGTIETGLASDVAGRTLTAGGTYFIRVRAFSATAIINPYVLSIVVTNFGGTAEVEANNTAATANSITTGAVVVGIRTGAIGAGGDSDYYSVVAAAADIVYFNVDADPERDGTGTDLVVEFRDPADVLLLSIDSSITGSLANPAAEGARFAVGAAGTYFVRVRHFSGTGTGTYHLMVASGVPSGCTITCPANITTSNNPNQCGAVVNYPAPTTGGTCGTVTCSPASGSFYPVGATINTCTATAGPSCQFTTTVNDTQPPTITVPADQSIGTAAPACSAVGNYPAPTATDNCPGVTAVCNPPAGSTFPLGPTTVTCTATDATGNTATDSFTETVVDDDPPVQTACPADIFADVAPGGQSTTVSFTDPTATDNCPGTPGTACDPASGDPFVPGTTTVACVSTDGAGNATTCTFDVVVGTLSAQEIPAASTLGLLALALLLGGAAVVALRRGA
jgi:hypothetical protein